ncbi:MAG: hypothetical protein WCV88_01820 [Patescibacteria group bacterium]|jgi:hypothetical protein
MKVNLHHLTVGGIRRCFSLFIVVIGCFFSFSHPVQAVNWSDCATESGTTTITNGNLNYTLTPVTAIPDTTQAFVLVRSSGDVSVFSTSRHLVTATITGTGTVQFDRQNSNGNAQVSYTIVQCRNSDKISVQRGTITLNSGASSNTGALTTPVVAANSLVLVSIRSDEPVAKDSSSLATASLQDDATVVVQRATGSTSTVQVNYQVVEFLTGSGVSVQTSEVTLGSGSASTTTTLATAVASDRTWVYCSYDATNDGLTQTSVACNLQDASTVTVQRAAASAYTNRVRVYAVTWPEKTVTVLTGTTTSDPTASDGTLVTEDIALGSTTAADPVHSFSYVTTNVSGTSNDYPRNLWLDYIFDASTLRTKLWRSEAAGSTDANTKYWQVINFPTPYRASGLGWIGNSVDDSNGTAVISFSGTNYGVRLEHGGCGTDCAVSGQAWLSDEMGWIDFSPTMTGNPAGDPIEGAHWNEETGELYGWARIRMLRDYETSLGRTEDAWGWVKLQGDISSAGAEYGVKFDADTLALSGWAWNGDPDSGFGWIKFDLSTSGILATKAWLRTMQGDVYSLQGFNATTAAPSGEYNATYQILANGSITNFSNQPGYTKSEETDLTDLGGVPTNNTRGVYRGDLGSLHVNELIKQAQDEGTAALPGDCTETIITGGTNPLGGAVYYCSGNLTINSNLTFYNGTGTADGSATFVVGGNLILNDNLNYYNNAIDTSIANLASVAFVVQGGVTVNPLVTHLVGAYIVLGDTASDFSTGDSTLPLRLDGLVMARSFALQRKALGSTSSPQPSEDIHYDGRVVANTPPGLSDLTATLPERTIQ